MSTVIHSLNKSNSTGPDGISSKILQIANDYISDPLSYIINRSFQLGIFPTSFKCAKVIPIFKKGNTRLVENYRPISLLNNMSKILEKLVHKRVMDF